MSLFAAITSYFLSSTNCSKKTIGSVHVFIKGLGLNAPEFCMPKLICFVSLRIWGASDFARLNKTLMYSQRLIGLGINNGVRLIAIVIIIILIY